MKAKTTTITSIFLTLILLVTMLGLFTVTTSAADAVVAWKDTDNDGAIDSGESTYTAISTALATGGTIKLTGDYNFGNNDTDELYIAMSTGTATLDINGYYVLFSSIAQKNIIILSGTADLTITDSKAAGTVDCESRLGVTLSDSAKLTFAGGIIKTGLSYSEYYLNISKSGSATFEITGGKHFSNPSEYVAPNHKVTVSDTNPKYTVSKIETSETVAWKDTDNDGVIDSGEQIFNNMDLALEAGGDLKMNSDLFRDSQYAPPGTFNVTTTTTIDLNGYSIVTSGNGFEVRGGSTLTIKDSTGGGQIWCQNDEEYSAIAVTLTGENKLIVEGGTIRGSISNYGASMYPNAISLKGGNYSFDPGIYIQDSTLTAGQDTSGLWGVRPKAENACSVTISGTYQYTGEAITPTIAVTDLDNSKTLTEDTDYTVSLSDNIHAGTATATVTFINDYRGSISKTFPITCDHTLSEHTTAEDTIGNGKHRFTCSVCNASLTEAHTFNANNECICGAKAVASVITTSTPPVETKYATIEEAIVAARSMNGSTVKLLDNIQLSSDLNISLGKFIIDLNGKTISEKSGFSDINLIVLEGTGTEITIDDSSAEKNGKITFGADNDTITVFSKLIVKNGTIENTATDGNAIVTGFVDKGTKIYGNVVIENGRFLGAVAVSYTTFDISGGEFVSLKINRSEGSVVGGMLKGGSFDTITVNGTSFADCIAEHSYYYNASDEMLIPAAETTSLTDVTVKQGTDLSKYAVITVGNATYDGSAHKPVVTVTVNGVALTEGTDFTVSYENNVNAGNAAKAVVTGKGIYSGTAEKEFTIEKADLFETDFTVGNTNPTYAYNATHEVAVTLPVGLDAQYVKVGYSQGGTILTDLPKNAGTYDVSISVVGSPNYNDAFFQDKWQLVIEPKEAIVTVGALGTEEYFFNGYPHTPTVFLDLGGLPAPSTEFEGCTVTYENNTQVGTAKVIVGGNYKGEATFVIQKGKPTIGLTSPLDKVMPGYVLTLTPTTNAIDNSYYTTTFTVEDGDGYSVDGFKITIDSGVAVNDVITIKVKSTETETYQAATGELKLTVGVPTADTSDLKAQIDDIQDQLDTLEEGAKDHATQDALNGAISDLQSKLDTLKGTVNTLDSSVDKNAEDIVKLVGDISSLAGEISALKILVDRVDALEVADTDLQNAINTNKDSIEDLAKELGDKYKALTDLIGTLPAEYTSVSEYVAAVKEDLTEVNATLTAAIEKLRGDMSTADSDLQKQITELGNDLTKAKNELNNAIIAGDNALSSRISSLSSSLREAKAALEKADEENKAALEAQIKAAEETLSAAIKALEKKLDDTKAALNQAIADGDTALDGKIAALNTSLTEAVKALEAADAADKAELTAKLDEAYASLDAAIKAVQKNLDDAKAALEAKDSELTETTNDLKTFILVVCVIASVALAGCGAFVIWFFIDRKKI